MQAFVTDACMKQHAEPRWPPGAGEMARLIRAHDWARTSLGAADTWPATLRVAVEIMLQCAVPTYIWWGPDSIQLYNDAAITMNRSHHPRGFAVAAGQAWQHSWGAIGPLAERCLEGGKPALGEDLPLLTDERSSADPAWFTISMTPLHAEYGEIGGMLVTMFDTTRRIRAETRLRIAEVRTHKMFQQAPGFVLVLRGPEHVIEFANDVSAKLIGVRDLAGRSVRDVDFGEAGAGFFDLIEKAYRTGERTEGFGVPVQLRDRSLGAIERRFLDFVVVPITGFVGGVEGTFVMGFDVTDRARAQRMLRESDARQRFLLGLSDALRPLADPIEIQAVAARMVGEHLGVSRALYADVEHDGDEAWFVVRRDYHVPRVTSAVGRYRASDFGVLMKEILEGRSIAICDVTLESELSPSERAAYLRIDARAWCAVPLIKEGVNVAVFSVHQTHAREWEDHEMALLEEMAERTWAAVERAHAEAALRESEARQKAAADRAQMLVAELQHRTRNLIAVVRAVAKLTLAHSGSMEEFEERFERRISAIARVQVLLSKQSEGARITFDDILHAELSALAPFHANSERVVVEGPTGIVLHADEIQTFALALHELITNAVKHGALSVPDGHLRIEWRLESRAEGAPAVLHLEWQESMPHRAVRPPTEEGGYGRELIEKALPHQLAATVEYDLRPDGLRCSIEVPLSAAHRAERDWSARADRNDLPVRTIDRPRPEERG
jgi:two-component sensor histidine kinase/PAS domain-containing protein